MALRTRRSDDAGTPTMATWKLDTSRALPGSRPLRDAFAQVVRESLDQYRLGRAAAARRFWADDIVWIVPGEGPASGEHRGAEAIFDRHRLLDELSGGSFRQLLLALEGSNGPVVAAYMWTEAQRAERTLSIPSLIVFEVSGGRIVKVTELPGDQAAWDRFWTD
jgi:uncharacterized protein